MLAPVRLLIIGLLLSFSFAPQSDAQETTESVGASGLPLPRFASLHTNEVNLRTGPGTRYPIEWVYVHEGVPVEITAEFEIWRRVRDWEGSEGWVHKSTLSGKRALIVTEPKRSLYKSKSIEAPVTATIEPSAVGSIKACDPVWCEVQFGDHDGYMQKKDFWGAYDAEVFD